MEGVIQALLSGASDDKILEMVAEIEAQDENNKSQNDNFASGEVYNSCIKINGKPILPPVMTEDTMI